MLNAGPALRIALYNASPKGLQNLSLVAAASVVVIAIQSVPLGPCKCIKNPNVKKCFITFIRNIWSTYGSYGIIDCNKKLAFCL